MSDYAMLQDKIRIAAARIAPQYVDIPYISVVSGSSPALPILTSTKGNWFGEPTAYAYQWKRDGATNIGTNSNLYTTVVGDSTHSITCVVSATNPNGTTAAPASNAIVVP